MINDDNKLNQIACIEDFLELLDGPKWPYDGRVRAFCPVCQLTQEGEPELCVRMRKERISVICYGGCKREDILANLGITELDLRIGTD